MSHPPLNPPIVPPNPIPLPTGGIPQPAVITIDGPTYVCDTTNIYEVTSFLGNTTVQTAAWQGCPVPGCVDLYVDATGAIFVLDTRCAQLYKYASFAALQANTVSKVWGSGTPGAGNGQFMMPAKVLTDSAGNIYVADSFNHRIVLIDPSNNWHYCKGYQASHFNTPSGIALDAAGNLYVADTGNSRIVRIRNAAVFITSSAPNASDWQLYPTFGLALQYPASVAVDPLATSTDTNPFNLYILDWNNFTAANPQGQPSPAPQLGARNRIVQLTGIATSSSGTYTINTTVGTPDYIWATPNGFYVTDDAIKAVWHFQNIGDKDPAAQFAQHLLQSPAGLCVTWRTTRA